MFVFCNCATREVLESFAVGLRGSASRCGTSMVLCCAVLERRISICFFGSSLGSLILYVSSQRGFGRAPPWGILEGACRGPLGSSPARAFSKRFSIWLFGAFHSGAFLDALHPGELFGALHHFSFLGAFSVVVVFWNPTVPGTFGVLSGCVGLLCRWPQRSTSQCSPVGVLHCDSLEVFTSLP